MDIERISVLLRPYWQNPTVAQLEQVSAYLQLFLRWNSRMNLTAIRDPEQMVTRHFGESFYLARILAEAGVPGIGKLVDVGSGAGFPGIPLKIFLPSLTLTLIEAQQRKAVFLREVLRTLNLVGDVRNVRAEQFAQENAGLADVVTMRAVERFEDVLPVAGSLVRSAGQFAVLIGAKQVEAVKKLLPKWHFGPLSPIPGAESRGILLMNQVG